MVPQLIIVGYCSELTSINQCKTACCSISSVNPSGYNKIYQDISIYQDKASKFIIIIIIFITICILMQVKSIMH